jgi:dihydroorotase
MQGSHKTLIRGGIIVCPFSGINGEVMDILVKGGRIAGVAPCIDGADARIVDASGRYVSPGWLDLHVHLREPGREDEETIASGRRAALAGGFTAICCMPNTEPAMDVPSVVEEVMAKASRGEGAEVFPVGAVSRSRQGRELAEMAGMHDSSGRVRAFSDDGNGIQDAGLMRRALEYVKMFDGVIISHCEDAGLAAGGQVREGARSFALGLRGWPSMAEEVMVARDLLLAEHTGSRLHLAHLSSLRSVDLLRAARDWRVRVTAEVTPHHLFFTEDDVDGLDSNLKVNPPLGTREDRQALRQALMEGTIDAIATDHAPHAREEKEREFDAAPFGLIGLETAFAACCTALVEEEGMEIFTLIDRLTRGPARVLGLEPPEYGGGIVEGGRADLVVFDPREKVKIDATRFRSLSRNCPFDGMKLKGRIRWVLKDGKVYDCDDVDKQRKTP